MLISILVPYMFQFVLFIFRLKRNLEERPKTYLDILDVSSIKNTSENPSDEEKTFVIHVLDNLPPLNE